MLLLKAWQRIVVLVELGLCLCDFIFGFLDGCQSPRVIFPVRSFKTLMFKGDVLFRFRDPSLGSFEMVTYASLLSLHGKRQLRDLRSTTTRIQLTWTDRSSVLLLSK